MRGDDEIDRELRFHIDARIDDLIASGMAPDEARRHARVAGFRCQQGCPGGGASSGRRCHHHGNHLDAGNRVRHYRLQPHVSARQ